MGVLTKWPLKPIVTIHRNDGGTYVYNPFTGTADFIVESLSVNPATFGIAGNFDLKITANPVTNAAANALLDKLTEAYEVEIQIGKTAATVIKTIRGLIENIIDDEKINLMELNLTGLDWGTDICNGRLISVYKEQDKLADGKTPDLTDKRTMIIALIKTVLGRLINRDGTDGGVSYEAYVGDAANLRVTVQEQGIVISDVNIKDSGRSVPRFEANAQKLSAVLNTLCDLGDLMWYVDPDKNIIIKQLGDNVGLPPTVLITDKPNDPEIANYTYYGIIGSACSVKRTVEAHRVRLVGLDSGQGEPDQKQETVAGGSTIVDNTYVGVQFQPTRRKCPDIAVYVDRVTADIDEHAPLIVELWEEGSAANPNGSLIRSAQKLAKDIGTTAGWHYFPINEVLNTAKKYWIVLVPPNVTGGSGNHYRWYYGATSGGTSVTSPDGVTWTPGTTTYAFRQDFTDDVSIIVPGSGVDVNTRHFHEEAVKKASLVDKNTLRTYLINEYRRANKRKEILTFRLYSPDTVLQVGQIVKVSKTSGRAITTTGTEANPHFIITSLGFQFNGTAEEQDGIFWLDVELSRLLPYP